MLDPKPCKETAATIYGWDCPLLAFIYLGFDCGSLGSVLFVSFMCVICRYHVIDRFYVFGDLPIHLLTCLYTYSITDLLTYRLRDCLVCYLLDLVID